MILVILSLFLTVGYGPIVPGSAADIYITDNATGAVIWHGRSMITVPYQPYAGAITFLSVPLQRGMSVTVNACVAGRTYRARMRVGESWVNGQSVGLALWPVRLVPVGDTPGARPAIPRRC